MPINNLWNPDTATGEERERRLRSIRDAMKGVVADAVRPTWSRGRGMLPEDHSKSGQGEQCVNGVPERILKQIEASEQAQRERAEQQRSWEEYRRKQMEEFTRFRAEHPWLLDENKAWDKFIAQGEKKT
jgi:hypothetical protein